MPLKKAETEKFRKRLLDLREQISRSFKGSSAEAKNPDESAGSQHQADQGTDDFDRTINMELTEREFHILRQIDRALEKIEDQTYGICDISGEDIPVARLEAVPYATMTVKAQDRLEKGLI
jgi:DnaK suppressor protein